jgi:hypothetical protein
MSTDPRELAEVANHMAAFSHVLCGKAGKFEQFNACATSMLAGSPPTITRLMSVRSHAIATERPLIWLHHSQTGDGSLRIGLIAPGDEQLFIVENCLLWKDVSDDRALLIPEGLEYGAFRFDDDFTLHHLDEAPTKEAKELEAGVSRACEWLRLAGLEQLHRGDALQLPVHVRAA